MPYHKMGKKKEKEKNGQKEKEMKYVKTTFKKKKKKVRKVPFGFHKMPNGQLMSNANHKSLKLKLK